MDLIKSKFLLLPVLFAVGLFLLDKLLLLPEVRDNFIQPGGAIYYRQRAEQIGRLREHLRARPVSEKNVVVFGDSRSFAIGDFVASFVGFRDVKVWNFAGPQALPVYHAWLAEKLF